MELIKAIAVGYVVAATLFSALWVAIAMRHNKVIQRRDRALKRHMQNHY